MSLAIDYFFFFAASSLKRCVRRAPQPEQRSTLRASAFCANFNSVVRCARTAHAADWLAAPARTWAILDPKEIC